MKDIRTYSREWFAGKSSVQQKQTAQNLDEKFLEKNNSVLSASTCVGNVEDVKKRLQNLPANGPSSAGQLVKNIGVDNLVSILDMDNDGKISLNEFANLASASLDDALEEQLDGTLSAKDLLQVYKNAMEADGASVAKKSASETTYTYKNGTSTTITTDQQGEMLSQSKTTKTAKGQTKTVTYDYRNETKYESLKDQKGREVYQYLDAPGKENDRLFETTYNKNGTKTTTVTTVGKVSTYQYDTQGRLISVTVEPTYLSDKKIGSTKQHDVGECWALSGVNALNTTSQGQKIIADSIQHNKDGSVTITLKGIKKSYTYSAEQIALAQYKDSSKTLATGDTDMNLLEMAIADYRYEVSQSVSFASLSVDANDPLSGGWNREALYYLTGQHPTNTYTASSTQKMLEKKMQNANNYAMTTSFKSKDETFNAQGKGEVVSGHVYSISRVTKDTVYLINPWDSSTEIPYPMSSYLKNADGVSSIDMSKLK